MSFIYSCLIRCAVPFAYAAILWRGVRDRSYWQGLAERLGFGPALPAQGIWLHAVSLGEMSAAAPLLKALRVRFPDIPLLLTTATPAGRARARALLGDNQGTVRFLPYDTPGSVRRFLARTRPRVAIIMETELWPNLFGACARGAIPVLLASARLSAKSVSQYRRFGRLFSDVFSKNLLVAAQTADDAARFKSIGAPEEQTRVIGNVKFDLQLDLGSVEAGRNLRAAYAGTRPVWIAGSTHAGEDEQLLDAHASLLKAQPSAVLLLAPRHKDRFAAVAELLTRREIKFARRSQMTGSEMTGGEGRVATRLQSDTTVLLVDTIGELSALYASADVAFVGGSLVAIGGHNLLEPAALGLPVLTGPSYFNAAEIARLLLARGAALQVASAETLAAVLKRLLDDPAMRERMGLIGKEIVAANRGSVARLLALIEAWLPAEHRAAAWQAYR